MIVKGEKNEAKGAMFGVVSLADSANPRLPAQGYMD